MSEDHECRKCYGKTLKVIREYLESRYQEGESLEVEIYGSYGGVCYIGINYATIIDKKHVTYYERLPANFPTILDSLLEQWRGIPDGLP
jgi:hypothetical protein